MHVPLGGVLRNRLELLLFLAIALVGIAPTLAQPLAMVGDGVDAFGTWWFFDWIRVCIERGTDPSFTTSFFWPHGKDNFAHTGNNFVDAVLSVPLQWLLGARYQPVWIVVVLLGNALTFRPLARLLLQDEERTFAATLLWLCNPYVIFEITAGRPTQAFLWFVPTVPYFLIRVAREGGWRHVACLGAAAALVAWTYWYQAIFTAFLLVPVALSELRRSAEPRATGVRWGASLALAAVLAVFFIIILLWDEHRLLATGVLFAMFTAGAAVFGLLARSALAARPRLLAGTLDELRKDAEHLK